METKEKEMFESIRNKVLAEWNIGQVLWIMFFYATIIFSQKQKAQPT